MGAALFDRLPLEIQETIASFLSYHELAACARVSQAWNTVFNPILWRHVEIPKNTDRNEARHNAWSSRLEECARNGALRHNGHLLRSIRLSNVLNSPGFFLSNCPSIFPQLTTVMAGDYFGCDQQSLAQFLDRCCCSGGGGLKVFVYGERVRRTNYKYRSIGDKVVDALLRHAGTLEVFQLGIAVVCEGRNIDRLLSSCPNLKELGCMGHHTAVHGGGLDAIAIKDSVWVCKNLEVFECPIRNIPRPDTTRTVAEMADEEPNRGWTVEESVHLQRQIYAKLAGFTKLRELTLSLPIGRQATSYSLWYRQYDCLAMSLRSGLGLLEGLGDLKVVQLEGMDVYVDSKKEQRWFKQHWPLATVKSTAHPKQQYEDPIQL